MHGLKLDKRVRFETPPEGPPQFGHPTGDWVSQGEVWASVRPMGSNERVAAFQVQSGGTHVVTVRFQRHLAALDGSARIVLGDRHLSVVGLPRNIDEANHWLVFDCAEISGGV